MCVAAHFLGQDAASGVDMKQAGDRRAYVNKLYDQALTLDLVTWLGTITTLPVVVKGAKIIQNNASFCVFLNLKGGSCSKAVHSPRLD